MSGFEESMKYNKLEVHLGSFKTNVKTALKIIEKDNLHPFVKSDAYGLGVQQITQALMEEGLFTAGVLNTQEAQKISSKMKILIFGPLENAEEFLSRPRWTPVLSSFDDLKTFSQAVLKHQNPRCIHIKLDLGMSRLGFEERECGDIISFLNQNKHLRLEGICAQLSRGEGIGVLNSSAQKQTAQFKNIGKKIKRYFPHVKQHIFNSASFLGCFSNNLKMEFGARLGGFLYGIKHDIENHKMLKKWSELDLQPVSTLKAGIISSRIIPQGGTVSYDSLWKAKTPSNIAVVSMGYANGLSRALTGSDVLFRGKRVKVRGAVCMNFFMIDLTPVLGLKEKPKRGEEVVIYGRQKNEEISIKEQAEALGSIPYEVMTHISSSVQRVYDEL